MSEEIKTWHSIERLYQVARDSKSGHYGKERCVVTYAGKVKLHGTNCGIRIAMENDDIAVFYQSRDMILRRRGGKVIQTLHGFEQWAEKVDIHDVLASDIGDRIRNGEQCTIYGEWCGENVQKGVAVSALDHNLFAIFGIRIGETDTIVDPAEISKIIGESFTTDRSAFVIPWYDLPYHNYITELSGENVKCMEVNLHDQDNVKEFKQKIETMIASIEKCDPLMKQMFNVDGIGEGLVWYPIEIRHDTDGDDRILTDCMTNYHRMCKFIFKSKTDEHKKAGKKPPKELTEDEKKMHKTVDAVITNEVLESKFTELFGDKLPDMQGIPKLIGSVMASYKEDADLAVKLAKHGGTWKNVSSHVSGRTVEFFKQRVDA